MPTGGAKRLPRDVNPLQFVALCVLLQAVHDARQEERDAMPEVLDVCDRATLLKWLAEPWADVLISVAGLDWLETPEERLRFLADSAEDEGQDAPHGICG